MTKQIYTADLKSQYLSMKDEILNAVKDVLESGNFINGPQVKSFENNLAHYLQVKHAIGCANGTDALQIALMALDLEEGDEVIVPAFTYAATVEVIALLKLTPVFADVEVGSFNLSLSSLHKVMTSKTKAIIPVHLFGQATNMEGIMAIAEAKNIHIIEDNAQSIGCHYINKNGNKLKTGTIGHIGCASFFPTKNLGCYGDGGVITTNNSQLAEKIRKICNHGQVSKYHHEILGVNSRLDTIQASILDVKLRYLDELNAKRISLAERYTKSLQGVDAIILPKQSEFSDHIFHQYTIRVKNGKRDALQQFLKTNGIHCVVYYPVPAHQQVAYARFYKNNDLSNSELLANEVLSLPVYPELTFEDQDIIMETIIEFYNG